jgi:membrane-associated phospholipid phosphatase
MGDFAHHWVDMLNSDDFWIWISRLGEAHVILPVAMALVIVFLLLDENRSVRSWAPGLGLAIALTVVSKVAFMGWGLGIAALDFTGVSGHSMLSAAVYPVLGHVFARRRPGSIARWGAILGYGLAALIAVSRVVTHAHSVSEAATGFMLGAVVSACAMGLMVRPNRRLPRWVWLSALVWLVIMPLTIKSSGGHGAIAQVALALSHRQTIYQRADLHRTTPTPMTPASVKPLHREDVVLFSH